MRRRPGLTMLCLLCLGFPGLATANPISSEVLRLRQVPSTMHVQVTYASIHNATPTAVKRDGQSITVSFTDLAGYTANTGSGLVQLGAKQFCDCNLSAGSHAYSVQVTAGGGAGDIASSLEVLQNYTGPTPKLDAGTGADLSPWDIPEPTDLQGIDCKSKCDAQPRSDGAAPQTDAGSTQKDSGAGATNPPEKDDGCSLAGQPAAAPLLLLAALLGLALIRRRR